jgi:hypothetical protein
MKKYITKKNRIRIIIFVIFLSLLIGISMFLQFYTLRVINGPGEEEDVGFGEFPPGYRRRYSYVTFGQDQSLPGSRIEQVEDIDLKPRVVVMYPKPEYLGTGCQIKGLFDRTEVGILRISFKFIVERTNLELQREEDDPTYRKEPYEHLPVPGCYLTLTSNNNRRILIQLTGDDGEFIYYDEFDWQIQYGIQYTRTSKLVVTDNMAFSYIRDYWKGRWFNIEVWFDSVKAEYKIKLDNVEYGPFRFFQGTDGFLDGITLQSTGWGGDDFTGYGGNIRQVNTLVSVLGILPEIKSG